MEKRTRIIHSQPIMLTLKEPYNQLSEHDEKVLTDLANQAKGDMCEIGCWLGHSTSILGARVKTLGTKLYVVDSFQGNEGTPLVDYAKEHNVLNEFIENMTKLELIGNI